MVPVVTFMVASSESENHEYVTPDMAVMARATTSADATIAFVSVFMISHSNL